MCWIAPVSVNLSTSYIRYQLPLEPPVYSSNRSVRMVEVKLKGMLAPSLSCNVHCIRSAHSAQTHRPFKNKRSPAAAVHKDALWSGYYFSQRFVRRLTFPLALLPPFLHSYYYYKQGVLGGVDI